jgi:hypothetical protein
MDPALHHRKALDIWKTDQIPCLMRLLSLNRANRLVCKRRNAQGHSIVYCTMGGPAGFLLVPTCSQGEAYISASGPHSVGLWRLSLQGSKSIAPEYSQRPSS